ncbi:helix-turn-helix transcriptional regulator [Olsenella sp. KGMB02461]|nr:helix-turn-helix transcriptional regulator [Olsenella sp. KGMB02461]
MASNLLEMRRTAGYRSASDFAEAQGIPLSTYARYESNPDKIPMERAWQLADALSCTIDAVVGREEPDPARLRGEVQLEYDSLTSEARALADEFREFVLQKDARIRARRRREEKRPYEALCYQYEQQMLAEARDSAAFGEVVSFGSVVEARSAFLTYLQDQAAKKRGRFSTKSQKLIDDQTIEKVMAAWDYTHGELEYVGMSVLWSSSEHAVAVDYDGPARGGDGGISE